MGQDKAAQPIRDGGNGHGDVRKAVASALREVYTRGRKYRRKVHEMARTECHVGTR